MLLISEPHKMRCRLFLILYVKIVVNIMSLLKTYDLFIAHAWFYSKGYLRVVELLDEVPSFLWRNYSAPRHHIVVDPQTEIGRRLLIAELYRQIRPVNCFLVVTGMYALFRYWIKEEVKIAQSHGIPIIGLSQWAQERPPLYIQQVSQEMVEWNPGAIVAAIRKYSL